VQDVPPIEATMSAISLAMQQDILGWNIIHFDQVIDEAHELHSSTHADMTEDLNDFDANMIAFDQH
jgi:hypothetical protein